MTYAINQTALVHEIMSQRDDLIIFSPVGKALDHEKEDFVLNHDWYLVAGLSGNEALAASWGGCTWIATS